jgi:hypothetical protein
LDVEEKEALEEEKFARELAAKKHTAKLVAANLAVVETVFSDMFAADESAALRQLPGFGDPLQSFQSEVRFRSADISDGPKDGFPRRPPKSCSRSSRRRTRICRRAWRNFRRKKRRARSLLTRFWN